MNKLIFLLFFLLVNISYNHASTTTMRRCLLLPIEDSIDGAVAFDVFQNILSSYAGPFYNMILINLAKNLKKNISVSYIFRKRLFKIFIELTSNIAFYSYEKTNGQGNWIIIRDCKDHFKIEAGNVIEKK